ncbi:Gfo/Idh/MocA family oxidoreductase [Natronolimnobius sp. AArcel1]|uniref:Gfo/Idh/MocA family protein n=1 Tax=Natronolimnobius sp. AArcel1 TaxID=1679093 RepID=UPI0013EAF8C6|nr:Gfo/Idh/MocA family oxidoreductase [Natronolimnobius sp. AArcel1]NGM70633.1 Gfo/Idh/MocA family oxidoreductase [Natronolimnobius sp. AArcel1]
MISVGLLGSGFMAQVHAVRYEAMDDVTVAGVASPSYPDAFAQEYTPEAKVYSDPNELLEAVDVDIVDICTPTPTHRDLVELAVEHGCDVLCEKPLERTLEDAQAIQALVADSDVTFMVGHVLRFFPQYERAREQVEAGEIGTPGTASCLRQSPMPNTDTWFMDEEISGGALLDLAIHDIDFLRWTYGEVESVFARRVAAGDDRYATATLRFENGAVGQIDARWPTDDSIPFVTDFELAGDEGLIEYRSEDESPIEIHTAIEEEPSRDPVDMVLTKDPYYRELEHFLSCVRSGEEPRVTATDAIEAMRISLAAIESADTGEPVVLEEFDGT